MLLVIKAREANPARQTLAEPERTYPLPDLDDIGLMDILAIKRQTGYDVSVLDKALSDVQTAGDDVSFGDMTEEMIIAIAVLVWLARRDAGETDLTLEQACKFGLSRLEFRPEPGDEVEAPAPNRQARRARAAATKKPAAKRSKPAKTTTDLKKAGIQVTPRSGGRSRTSPVRSTSD